MKWFKSNNLIQLSKQFIQIVHTCGKFSGLAWQTDPYFTVIYIILLILSSLLPATSAWLIKQVVDHITHIIGNGFDIASDTIIIFGVLFLLSHVANFILYPASEAIRGTLSDRLNAHIDQLIMKKSARLPDLLHFEKPEFYDRLQFIQNYSSLPENVLWLCSATIRYFVILSSLLILLIQIDLIIPLALIIVSIPHLIAEYRHYKYSYDVLWENVPGSRKLDYYYQTVIDPQAVKEMKMFGSTRYFIDLYTNIFNKIFKNVRTIKVKHARVTAYFALLNGLGIAAMYGYVVILVSQSIITSGDIALYFSAVNTIQESFWMLTLMGGQFIDIVFQLQNFLGFLEIKPTINLSPVDRVVKIPQSISHIEFSEVDFTYPGDQRQSVLKHLSFSIHTGETVALVGQNGAGKSTIVKLLCRFYDPTNGSIFINNIPICDYDIDELRKHISVIFQDFSRFYLTVKENIGIGKIHDIDNLLRIKKAADRGQATSMIQRLPHKYDSLLGRHFEDGIELSGGEWQKIAASRAFMRETGILILDEPTAALDAEAEHAIYQRFKELTNEKATLLISHRLSTISMADRILVLKGGKIIEEGPHTKLMEKGGEYHTMCMLQAGRYIS